MPDANILLYAYNADSPHHAKAREWLENALSAPEPFCLSWQTITAFLRISTNPRAFPKPLNFKEAIEIVDEWLAQPQTTILLPTANYWAIFKKLIVDGKLTGALIMDAHLAALAIDHNANIITSDRDFNRFTNLKIINPLTL